MFYEFNGYKPVVHKSSFVHPQAAVTGNVIIGKDCYIGPGAALRGDWGQIIIEDGVNSVTFKKGEQVTLDEGNSYWNVEGLTEDGRLKLSRKFEKTTESTTVSDVNDVKPYLSYLFKIAPFSNRYFTISSLLFFEAINKGVYPHLSY